MTDNGGSVEQLSGAMDDITQSVVDFRRLPYAGLHASAFLEEHGCPTPAAVPIIDGYLYGDFPGLSNSDHDALLPLIAALIKAVRQISELREVEQIRKEAFTTVPPVPDGFEDCLRCETSWKIDPVLPAYVKQYAAEQEHLPDVIEAFGNLADIAGQLNIKYQDMLGKAIEYHRAITAHLDHREADKRFNGSVYLIENVARDIVKIGYSASPALRLCTLQTAVPDELKLLSHFPGSPFEERALHARFKTYGVGREWFKKHPTILRTFETYSAQRVAAPSERLQEEVVLEQADLKSRNVA